MAQPIPYIEVDAQGKILGRLATSIALLLQGKHDPNYEPQKDMPFRVKVKGAAGIKVTGTKMATKLYRWYTGYPGGLKEKKLQVALSESPAYVLRHAVEGMLPKNRLRSRRMKRLVIES